MGDEEEMKEMKEDVEEALKTDMQKSSTDKLLDFEKYSGIRPMVSRSNAGRNDVVQSVL